MAGTQSHDPSIRSESPLGPETRQSLPDKPLAFAVFLPSPIGLMELSDRNAEDSYPIHVRLI